MGQYAKNTEGHPAPSWISKKKKTKQIKQNKQIKRTKKSSNTSFSKILNLQKDYLRDNEGWNRSVKQEYSTYLEGQIGRGFFHYQNLSSDDITELVRLYNVKVLKKKMKLKAFRKTKEAKRQLRKMISETREEKVSEKRAELLIEMNSEMRKWGVTLGSGEYLIDRDRTWDKLYQKIHSDRYCHLFDIQSDETWYQFLRG